jgi:ADP-ribose pyrophosphatase
MAEKRYRILDQSFLHQGFLTLEQIHLTHSLFLGGESQSLQRELLHQGHVTAVLLYDPAADKVVMVEQFRVGMLPHEPELPWMMELVAGYLEAGETPEAVARRECEEEAGCIVGDVYPICSYYVSPGVSSEMMHLYWASVDSRGIGGVHGLDHEDEDIKVHVLPWHKVEGMLLEGGINSATPILALMWLREHREQIRRDFQS